MGVGVSYFDAVTDLILFIGFKQLKRNQFAKVEIKDN